MRVMRLRQLSLLMRPTARVMGWTPMLVATVLGLAYVMSEATGAFVDYRVQVLRIGVLLLAMGSAFILDDPTEETLGHVPTPLLLRRGLRVALALPWVAASWFVLVAVAGEVLPRDGGPLPIGDLTLEAATMFMVAMSAACVGALVTSDRLGGIVAAPLLGLVVLAMLLPPDQRLILGSISDPRWEQVHDRWTVGLLGALALFVLINRSPTLRRSGFRLRPRSQPESR